MNDALLHRSLSMGSVFWYNQTAHYGFPRFCTALPQLLYTDMDHELQVYRGIIERKKVHVKSHSNADTICPSIAV